ncbi:hypothetical protein AMATHDRAFT_62978 [Amanita thiersii Skay4041]|uniref:Phosphatidic acid phosphatase type 2/haloperoxidase domain-containing protein n=1 Tax=Amanita thiersii Skay4041 TaxID=703135 RepID=A0A2A9NEU4_9AGAR|nr:hypothetical protein AMATHDRAFT_62978 [Amanita thiersii Skay4041]
MATQRLRGYGWLNTVLQAFFAGVARLDKSLSPINTLSRLQCYEFRASDAAYLFHLFLASFWLTLMEFPPYPYKLVIPLLYSIFLLVPLTSQFFLPAIPIATYLLSFYSSRFISPQYRPSVSVSLLPTLESVLYGANISDILTRFTHPILDIIAWIPYGVGHFTIPFIVALFLWLFRSKPVLRLWGTAFGYMNVTGVLIQIIFPCSAPWYELLYGLTPANYGMPGSPGGLARIDALFHSSGYTKTFTNSPLVFGAFPSLHSACATMEALFISHFFPQYSRFVWTYAAVLYWSTMYLTHHYLIDVVGGACLAVAFFYFFLPDELKGPAALLPPHNFTLLAPNAYTLPFHMTSKFGGGGQRRSKYELYDLEDPRRGMSHGAAAAASLDDDEYDYYNEDDYEIESSSSSGRGAGGGDANRTVDDADSSGTARPRTPASAVPLVGQPPAQPKRNIGGSVGGVNGAAGRGHRHTASIASLIRGEERSAEDGWSPVADNFVGSVPAARRAGGIV